MSEYDYNDKRAVPLPKVNKRNKKLVSMNLDKLNASFKGGSSTKSMISDVLSNASRPRFKLRGGANREDLSVVSDFTDVGGDLGAG